MMAVVVSPSWVDLAPLLNRVTRLGRINIQDICDRVEEKDLVNQTRPDYIHGMPSQILNITEAKAKLSSVIERVVSKGEEFLIGRAGKPVAKIIPYEVARKPRRLGIFQGKIKISKDFDEWPKDLAQSLGMKK